MPLFKDHRAYRDFVKSVKCRYRYFPSAEAKQFLDALKMMVGNNEASLSAGAMLVRAQLGNDFRPLEDHKRRKVDEVPCAYPPKRMKPLADRAKEGRANPKGIPYLYMSDDPGTAIAETRPWIGQYVSIGFFKICRDCKLVHFTENRKRSIIYLASPPKEEVDRIVWHDVNDAFSRPIQSDDQTPDYAPTQVIAEFIKTLGYDGLVYRSRLGKGLNVALFDLDAADLVSCGLYQVDSVSYRHSQADNPYVVRKTTGRRGLKTKSRKVNHSGT